MYATGHWCHDENTINSGNSVTVVITVLYVVFKPLSYGVIFIKLSNPDLVTIIYFVLIMD